MLVPMQQAAALKIADDKPSPLGWTPESSGAPPNFAALLAALTAPAPATSDRAPDRASDRAHPWNDDALGEDVATLSYESALRAHSRYKPSGPGSWPLPQADDAPLPPRKPPMSVGVSYAAEAALPAANEWSGGEESRAMHSLPAALDESRKCASVTIRISKAECAQLHNRAAEAGLTVSAYLRSCTFEAEALRAQVKEALASLRSATTAEKQIPPARRRWWPRLWSHARLRSKRS